MSNKQKAASAAVQNAPHNPAQSNAVVATVTPIANRHAKQTAVKEMVHDQLDDAAVSLTGLLLKATVFASILAVAICCDFWLNTAHHGFPAFGPWKYALCEFVDDLVYVCDCSWFADCVLKHTTYRVIGVESGLKVGGILLFKGIRKLFGL